MNKNLILCIAAVSICFASCCDEKKEPAIPTEALNVPEKGQKMGIAPFGTVPLREAQKSINLYRNYAGYEELIKDNKKHGLAHRPAEFQKYIAGFTDFDTTHRFPSTLPYVWGIGFTYGICVDAANSKLAFNTYVLPVIIDTATGKIKDYFTMKEKNDPDTVYYLIKTLIAPPGRRQPAVMDQPSFVFDEGTLWP